MLSASLMASSSSAATPPRAFLYIQPPHTATATVKEWLQHDVPETKDAGLLLQGGKLVSPEWRGLSRHENWIARGLPLPKDLFTFSFLRSPFQRVVSAASYIGGNPPPEHLPNCSARAYLLSVHRRRYCFRGLYLGRHDGPGLNASLFRQWCVDKRFLNDTRYLGTLSSYLTAKDSRLAVDWVGLASNLEAGYNAVCQEIGARPHPSSLYHCLASCHLQNATSASPLPALPPSPTLASPRREEALWWLDLFDKPSWQAVARTFATDLVRFAPMWQTEPWWAAAHARFGPFALGSALDADDGALSSAFPKGSPKEPNRRNASLEHALESLAAAPAPPAGVVRGYTLTRGGSNGSLLALRWAKLSGGPGQRQHEQGAI